MYTTTIDLTKRPRFYREKMEEFLERKYNKAGVYCEFGHPNDLTKLIGRVVAEQAEGKPVRLDTHLYLPEEEQIKRMNSLDDDRCCALLIDPVWTETTLTFRIIPTGPYAEVLTRMLNEGRVFIPGTRAFLRGDGRYVHQEVQQITALDLIPSEIHIDSGRNQWLPFVAA